MNLESELVTLRHTEGTILHRDRPATGDILVILVTVIFGRKSMVNHTFPIGPKTKRE